MHTYDLKDEQSRVYAFEVGNFLLTRLGLYRLVRRIPGCRVTRRPTAFMQWSSEDNDEFCEFEVDGMPFVAWEPWGDNSRYWVGPKVKEGQAPQWSPTVDRVREAFLFLRDRKSRLQPVQAEYSSSGEVMDAILALDDLHRLARISDEAYQKRRNELKDVLRQLA